MQSVPILGPHPPVCHEEPRPADPDGGGACQVALAGLQSRRRERWRLGWLRGLPRRPHTLRPNIYADFSIGAAKLLDTKAAVLLRHANTRLHLQAVASLAGVPCGAQVNTTWNVTAPCADALSVWRARASGALGGLFSRGACSVGDLLIR